MSDDDLTTIKGPRLERFGSLSELEELWHQVLEVAAEELGACLTTSTEQPAEAIQLWFVPPVFAA